MDAIVYKAEQIGMLCDIILSGIEQFINMMLSIPTMPTCKLFVLDFTK